VVRGPRTCSDADLRRVGVERVEARGHSFWLRCLKCGQEWSPNIPPSGKRLARGYWQCPDGCNAPER